MAAGSTYTSIASYTTSGSASTYTFSSISGAYTDLILIANYDSATAGNQSLNMRFNGDTTTTYSWTYVQGSGSAASSGRSTADNRIYCGSSSTSTSNISSTAIIQILSYANTNIYKSTTARCNNPDYYIFGIAGLWRSTAAITSITLYQSSYNFINGTTFTLYGITAA